METKEVNGESAAPFLMITRGNWLEKHSIFNVPDKKICVLNMPVLTNKYVIGSVYGWLVLVEDGDDNDEEDGDGDDNDEEDGDDNDEKDGDDNDEEDGDCCLFNPISMDKIALPKLSNAQTYNQCILSKPPTEPDCYILFNSLLQSFCRIGDKKYVTRTSEQQYEEDGFVGRLRAIVSFQGKNYGFMSPGDEFVTIDFVGEAIEFRTMPMVGENGEPWVIPHSSRSYNIWMIESSQSCGGELLMVQKIFSTLDVDLKNEKLDFAVFRVDTNQMKCVELDSIGRRTIFLSHNGGGYCCPSSTGLKPNSIYYTNLLDRHLHVFDLEDRSTTSQLLSRKIGYKSITSWVQHEIFRNQQF